MSYPADCPACIAGQHSGHDAAHGTRKGLIGGTYCACTGDCAERAAAAFAKAFPVTASDARPPSDTGTTDRCGCELPFHYTDIPVQCGCGRWYAVVTFHDYELGTSWRGWDVMPDPEATR